MHTNRLSILLDVGNTSVTYGIAKGNILTGFGSCLYDDIPKIIKKCYISGKYNEIIVLISSVVPKFNRFIANELSDHKRLSLKFIGRDLRVPIRSNYQQNNKLGQDRLIAAFGALKIYGTPALIIDYGTAITFDFVSKSGVFEGGMIIPGPEISFQALIERAALLPKRLRLPHKSASFVGKTSYDCMRSGILEGFGAMTDELIRRFKRRYGQRLKVIATGGFVRHLKPFTKELRFIDPKLSIKTLFLLSKNIL